MSGVGVRKLREILVTFNNLSKVKGIRKMRRPQLINTVKKKTGVTVVPRRKKRGPNKNK